MSGIREYVLIKEAAEYLGVSPATLRNWERHGRIRTFRHPINRYRLYKQTDLDALLLQIETSGSAARQGGRGEEG